MYQFIVGIAFELVLIVLFSLGCLSLDGRIQLGATNEDFEEWRWRNGRMLKLICIMTIIVLLASILSKYFQYFHTTPLPSLQAD